MEKILGKFEKIISTILLLVIMVVIVFQTLELLWALVSSLYVRIQEVGLEYRPEYTQTVVVLFFSILLTLEIMETIKVFRQDHQAKIQIILIVVMIAISRKVFVLDMRDANIEEGLAIAALILAFSASYFFVRIRNNKKPKETDIEPGERDFIN